MAVHNSCKCKPATESACDDGLDIEAIDRALATIAANTVHKKPKGFTVEEYASKKGIGRRTAQEHLTVMYKAGALERTIWKNEAHKLSYVYRLTNGTKH